MSSVRQVADRFDEFKRNGFEDRQARVLAMAIDETVEDRLDARFKAIDARFDGIDAQLKGVVTGFAGIESQIKGLHDQMRARKFEITVIVLTSMAALIAIGLAAYEHGGKQLLGSP